METKRTLGKFDNISKGKWKSEYNGQYWEVRGGELLKPNISIHDFDPPGIDANEKCVGEETKANAEFIAFAGNIAQKYNIEHLEEVVKALKEAEILLKISDKDPMEIRFTHHPKSSRSMIRIKEALKSIDKI